MVRPERFELPTYCSGGNRSIQLSYGRAVLILHEGLVGQQVPPLRGFAASVGMTPAVAKLSCLVAFAFEFAHGGLNELLGSVDLVEDGLQVERGLGGVAIRDAVDAMLADKDEGVGEHVERDGKTASLGAEHELVLFYIAPALG